MKKEKIGIIGLGFVGSSLRDWLDKNKESYKLFLYDKYKKIGSMEEVNNADIIFICLPTPFHENNGGYDDSLVESTISNIEDGKIIVIKSTILPGSTEKFAKEYPKKKIFFNPEFLRAKTAKEDFLSPDMQYVGYVNEDYKSIANRILNILPKASYSRILKSTEAETIKYFLNSYLAIRVIFANQIYDLCEKLGIDYDAVKECVVKDRRISDSHFEVWHEGYRGYGGFCLPKDTKSLLGLAKKMDLDFELLEAADAINEKLNGGMRI